MSVLSEKIEERFTNRISWDPKHACERKAPERRSLFLRDDIIFVKPCHFKKHEATSEILAAPFFKV